MDQTAAHAGKALVGVMAGDSWRMARAALTDLVWRSASLRPRTGVVTAKLDELRTQARRARDTGDAETEEALAGAWQLRLQQLLTADPAIADDLRYMLEQILRPALARAGDAAGPGRPDQRANSDPAAIRTAVIGQAAAGLTAVAALIYGSGALTIALRLYFTRLSWETVLGQLPHDVILTSGFGQIVLPAIIIGVLGAVLLNFLVNGSHRPDGAWSRLQLRLQRYLTAKPSFRHFLAWLGISAVLGALSAAVSLPYYIAHTASYQHPQVVIPAYVAIPVAAAISALAIGIALILMPPPAGEYLRPELSRQLGASRRTSGLTRIGWQVWVGALVGFAAIPGISTFAAVTLFPYTLACSSQFKGGELSGDLIAANGGWAYMVEYRMSDYRQDFIAAVPLSSVQLETIGYYGSCARLNAHSG
jgi:hypothetical protein